MKIVYGPFSEIDLGEFGIQVPLLPSRTQKLLEQKYLKWIGPEENEAYELALKTLPLVHSKDYCRRLLDKPNEVIEVAYELKNPDGSFNRYEPLKAKKSLSELTHRLLLHAGVSVWGMSLSLDEKEVFHLGGGMHHASYDSGGGFCLVNDIVMGIKYLQALDKVKHAWVIDVDAHFGDGTASICSQDSSITTLSIHMQSGWPLQSGLSKTPSDIDIGVKEGEEFSYLERLKTGLANLEKNFPLAQMAVVILGADPWEKDELPSSNLLNLSSDQMLQRDLLIRKFLMEKNIPTTYLMGGGYGRDSWKMYDQFLREILT